MKRLSTTALAVTGSIIMALVMILGSIWMGSAAGDDTGQAVRTVSLLYLDELAGRREQVVGKNLSDNIDDMRTAIELMTEEDLSDIDHLMAYQARMKRIYNLEKFAFVDDDGLIYTSLGILYNIDDYSFDHTSLSGPEISILNLTSPDKKVVIALPVDLYMDGIHLSVCFMEIDMDVMLSGVSMQAQGGGATFCNIYTTDGIALSDTVLGGLSMEDNLLDAMRVARFDAGYSYEDFIESFTSGQRGVVSFDYNGIMETLSYVPVTGTDWILTYLIRESVISEKIRPVTDRMIMRSFGQSVLTAAVMAAVFIFILRQSKRTAKLELEAETARAEVRGKESELEQSRALQEKLREQSGILSEALSAAEQANVAKTAFLSNMSHEIRTPMNAIIGLDSIALNDPDTPEKTKGYLRKIGDSAEHLLNLINDILDMSRIESGRITLRSEEFSFRGLLEALNTMFSSQCQEKGLDYRCDVEGDICDYYIGDGMKLRQVLINILSNAVKFTPTDGSVTLSVECTARYEGRSTLRFRVSDTGIGMSEDFIPHIFDTFTQEDSSATNRYGSTGLGMAITKNIVDMMNGTIGVESVKGEGTVFTVTVTLKDSDRKDGCEGDDETVPGELSVLIVDDDPVACEHARLVMEQSGFRADTALSGEEAVEIANLRHARMEPYDIILLDWKMPGMDGIETSRQIRSVTGDESAIIILTAYSWDGIEDDAREAGVDSFISKPVFAASVMEEYSIARKRRGAPGRDNGTSSLAGKRVLLAEDVDINAEIMMMLLDSKGIKADLAKNGREAVEMFSASAPGTYDAVLMDMRMPEMDGLEATGAIRAMDREDAAKVPIIALTANAFDEDVQRSLQAGLNAHLSKPVDPDMLFRTLLEYTSGR